MRKVYDEVEYFGGIWCTNEQKLYDQIKHMNDIDLLISIIRTFFNDENCKELPNSSSLWVFDLFTKVKR